MTIEATLRQDLVTAPEPASAEAVAGKDANKVKEAALSVLNQAEDPSGVALELKNVTTLPSKLYLSVIASKGDAPVGINDFQQADVAKQVVIRGAFYGIKTMFNLDNEDVLTEYNVTDQSYSVTAINSGEKEVYHLNMDVDIARLMQRNRQEEIPLNEIQNKYAEFKKCHDTMQGELKGFSRKFNFHPLERNKTTVLGGESVLIQSYCPALTLAQKNVIFDRDLTSTDSMKRGLAEIQSPDSSAVILTTSGKRALFNKQTAEELKEEAINLLRQQAQRRKDSLRGFDEKSAVAAERKSTLIGEIKEIERHLKKLENISIPDLGRYFMHMEGTYPDGSGGIGRTGEEIMRSGTPAQKRVFQEAIRKDTLNNPNLKTLIPDDQERAVGAERASFFPFLVDRGGEGDHLDILGNEKGRFSSPGMEVFLAQGVVASDRSHPSYPLGQYNMYLEQEAAPCEGEEQLPPRLKTLQKEFEELIDKTRLTLKKRIDELSSDGVESRTSEEAAAAGG